jgi:endonuclease/exonuclease/phosphatase family metal-dependent hydrolase
MAGNLSSGNNQTYDPGEGLRIFAGLHPDVAMVQEFNYGGNTDADFQAFVDAGFGPGFTYVRGAPTQIPNGIVSRYPVLASGDWTDPNVTNRAFTWAHIDLPGPRDLWVVSLHLLTSSSTNRDAEAKALVQDLQTNVPAGDLLVLGGDLNTASRTEAAIQDLSAVVDTAAPYPADQAGNSDTNASRAKPYDWVLASPSLVTFEVPVQIGGNQFDGGLVFDSRVYTPLSDVAPVLSTDSAATNMQHMGVVKDFLIGP